MRFKQGNGFRKPPGYVHYPHFGEEEAGSREMHGFGKDKSQRTVASSSAASLIRYMRNRKTRNVDDEVVVFPGYSQKVLTSNWFYPIPSFPKDFDAYNPPGGNNFRSTYNRWGTSEDRMISEVKAAQESFMREIKKPKAKIQPPLFNLITLRTIIIFGFNIQQIDFICIFPTGINLSSNMEDFLTEGSELLTSKPVKYTDIYTTTNQRDFINHYPQEPKMFDRTQLYKPETKYRNLLTELAHPRRPGFNKFYDENVEYLNAKKASEIPPPPWALHYDPCPALTKEKKDEKCDEKETAKETCAECS